MSGLCNKCKLVVPENAVFIKCCECVGVFHPECTKIRTSKKLDQMSEQGRASWKCDECVSEISSREGDGSNATVLLELRKLHRKIDKSYDKMVDMDKKLEVTNDKLAQLQGKIDELQVEQNSLKNKCDDLGTKYKQQSDETTELRQELRELQQYTRRENLEIVGIPLTNNEDVYAVLSAVAGSLGVQFSRQTVSGAHRLPGTSRQKYPSIIVRFVSRQIRDTWMAAARTKRRLETKDIAPSLPSGPVFVNEHLTRYNKMLLSRGKALVNEGKLSYAWVRDGKILVRKEPNDRAQKVVDINDFSKY